MAGPHYDMGVGMFVVYGFLLPGALYLAYNVLVLLGRWWGTKRRVEGQRSLFATQRGHHPMEDAQRTRVRGACAVDLGYSPLRLV